MTKGTKTPDDQAQSIAHDFRLEFGSPCGMHHCGRCLDLAARIREYGEHIYSKQATRAEIAEAEIARLRDALERLCVATSAIEGTSIEYSKAIELSEAFRQAQRLLGREGEKK